MSGWEMGTNFALIVVVMVVAGLGCGVMDSDPPAPAPTNSEQSDSPASNGEQSSEEEEQEVAYPFEASEEDENSVEGEAEKEQADQSSPPPAQQEYSCGVLCVKALWCRDSVPDDLGRCVERCEDGTHAQMVDEEVLVCAEEIDGCAQMNTCDQQIQLCESICFDYGQCGDFGDDQNCQSWCADQFWTGHLDFDVAHCIAEIPGARGCAEMAACGLPEEPSVESGD